MPVTRADLKISRDYHNRVAFSTPRFFVTIISGTVLALGMAAYGVFSHNDLVAFSSIAVAALFAVISMRILNVKERPHKHLQRLLVEVNARKELDRAKFS